MTASVHVLVLVMLGGSTGGERSREGVSDEVLHGNGATYISFIVF